MSKNKFILRFILLLYALLLLSFVMPITRYGIIPRTAIGLIGIFTAPLLHGGLQHLLSNTVPLLILLFVLLNFYPNKALKTIALIVIAGGSMVWIFGRTANHIGASGLIYGLAAFIISNGFFEKKIIPILISLLIIILYGGLIWGVLPFFNSPRISWEGHLFGAISGVLIAYSENKKTSK